VREVAESIELQAVTRPTDLRAACTSLGICLSASRVGSRAQTTYLYTLSSKRRVLKREAAEILAGLIVQLHHHQGLGTLIEGSSGLFHFLIHQTDPQPHNLKESAFQNSLPIGAPPTWPAASDGGQVTMTHLLHGARRELQKMGRLVYDEDQ
jgi:hypothetical protein